jgi:tetratricopeptide (TPR) repeat protein
MQNKKLSICLSVYLSICLSVCLSFIVSCATQSSRQNQTSSKSKPKNASDIVGFTANRVLTYSKLQNEKATQVDQDFMAALNSVIQSADNAHNIYTIYSNAIRIVKSPLGKSQYADDLIYDLFLQMHGQLLFDVTDENKQKLDAREMTELITLLENKYPNSSHLMPALLIRLAAIENNVPIEDFFVTQLPEAPPAEVAECNSEGGCDVPEDESSSREVQMPEPQINKFQIRLAIAEWIKNKDDSYITHSPFFKIQDFKNETKADGTTELNAKTMAFVKMQKYRDNPFEADGFNETNNFYALIQPMAAAGNETWIWESIRILEAVKNQDLELAIQYKRLGDRRNEQGDFQEALKYYKKSYSLNNENKEVYRLFKRMEFELKLISSSGTQYTPAENNDVSKINVLTANREAKARNLEGMKFYREKKYSEASNAFKKSVALDAHYGTAHFNLACTLALMGEVYQAIPALELAIKLNPGFYLPKAKQDADFTNIRNSEQFRKLIELYSK